MKKDIKQRLKQYLNDEKYAHTIGCEAMAIDLAKKFNVDREKASLAGLLHDCAKCLSNEELHKIINEENIEVSEMEMQCAKTLHAPVSAHFARMEFGISDDEVLSAIRWHTIGHVNMSLLDKVVFLADKIELETRPKEFTDKVQYILEKTNNIDEAVLLCYDVTIRSLLDRKMVINPVTIDVYNCLIVSLLKNK